MKKTVVSLMVTSILAVALPVMAEDAHQHGASHQVMDEQCVKDCDRLLRNCTQEVDSIQQRIKKLQSKISQKGADNYTLEELKVLDKKLKEANETLRVLEKPR